MNAGPAVEPRVRRDCWVLSRLPKRRPGAAVLAPLTTTGVAHIRERQTHAAIRSGCPRTEGSVAGASPRQARDRSRRARRKTGSRVLMVIGGIRRAGRSLADRMPTYWMSRALGPGVEARVMDRCRRTTRNGRRRGNTAAAKRSASGSSGLCRPAFRLERSEDAPVSPSGPHGRLARRWAASGGGLLRVAR
jgi:hypothetical protein